MSDPCTCRACLEQATSAERWRTVADAICAMAKRVRGIEPDLETELQEACSRLHSLGAKRPARR